MGLYYPKYETARFRCPECRFEWEAGLIYEGCGHYRLVDEAGGDKCPKCNTTGEEE